MEIELDREDPTQQATLATLPRFNAAEIQRRRLRVLLLVSGALAAALVVAAAKSDSAIARSLLSFNSAALLLLCAGLQSGYWAARWRALALGILVSRVPAWLRPRPVSSAPDTLLGDWTRLRHRLGNAGRFVSSRISDRAYDATWVGVSAYLALLIVRKHWDPALSGADLGRAGSIAGGTALLFAFVLLVLERDFARYSDAEWPEARPLSRITRIVIATVLLSGVALFFSAEGSLWPIRAALFAGLFPAALAVEWLGRVAASLFSRRNERLEPKLLARTRVGAVLTWPPPSFQSIQDNLQSRFGIDLRQNWAFAFVRRAFVPIVLAVAVVGWLLTGVAELPADRRGVYEVFGRPAAVVGPGLHAGLPWPFSRMRPLENGVVHEIATALPSDGPGAPDTSAAEDAPPASYNRLWDASHQADKALLIASATNHRETFQIVNMDVRFFYRIRLTPEAALDATYKISDLPTLIRSTASRVLVDVFASRTLDGVLGEERMALSQLIGTAVQARLDALSSGVEILATVVEAIHPPAGAADAYHSVQAAQITSQAAIARERGRAAEQINQAEQSASAARDAATATARDTLAAAETLRSRFDSEKLAYRSAGNAFLFENYLSQLSQGLSGGKLVILDHRIADSGTPTIDLRSYGAPAFVR
jgi:regulator of protease activity HflC (stomatin/prohibitin superfamily)